MLYKCNYCDPIAKIIKDIEGKRIGQEKQIKTVDTDNGDYIVDEKRKYYHIECYRKHLTARIKTKLTEDQIEHKIEDGLTRAKLIVKEAKEKDDFLQWIMDFYEGSLPTYFLKKLQAVREGKYEGLDEEINYATLLDIYKHMEKYLNNVALKKGFNEKNVSQRMNYDLAVVVGNYNDYKRYKSRQSKEQIKSTVVEKQIEVTNKVKTVVKKDKKEEFDIMDHLEDLTL